MSEDELETMIDKVVSKVDAAHRSHIEELVDKHEHLLYGNGKEGLTTKIDRIERAVTRWSSIGWRIAETLIVTGVIGLIILIVQAGLFKP